MAVQTDAGAFSCFFIHPIQYYFATQRYMDCNVCSGVASREWCLVRDWVEVFCCDGFRFVLVAPLSFFFCPGSVSHSRLHPIRRLFRVKNDTPAIILTLFNSTRWPCRQMPLLSLHREKCYSFECLFHVFFIVCLYQCHYGNSCKGQFVFLVAYVCEIRRCTFLL